jgi:glutamate dehydrogenase
MADRNGPGSQHATTVDRVVRHAASVDSKRADEFDSFLRTYLQHVEPEDLSERRIEDLFGAAADHLQLAKHWDAGSVGIRALNPRIQVDGWESEHTVILIVTDDLPFLVDSVIVEVSRLELGIHLVVHPVMADVRTDGGSFCGLHASPEGDEQRASLILVEVDRQAGDEELAHIEAELRRVLNDVRLCVSDWAAMRSKMTEIASALADGNLPVDEAEIVETQKLLEWLADDHFTFLGYREYDLSTIDDVEVLGANASSGLGILRSEEVAPPRPIANLPPGTRDRLHEKRLLNLTKATSKASVHRASYMDYIGIKTFDSHGTVTGERRFLGLFTSEAYSRSVTRIPRVERIVREVVERAAFPSKGHDHKRLMTILERYPRDELFQMSSDELFDIVMSIAGLQERRRLRLFTRVELFGRFVTCLVYLPRDRYNTQTRVGIERLLTDAYDGSIADWSTSISESVLARLDFLVRVGDGDPSQLDVAELESRIALLIKDWDDDFSSELIQTFGEDVGVRLGHKYSSAFSTDYRNAFDPRTAAADAQQLELLDPDAAPRLNAYREPGHPTSEFKLKVYREGGKISLTRIMPPLSNLGLTVLDERPYQVSLPDGRNVWIYDFALEHGEHQLDFADAASLLEESFSAVWTNDVADDGFNRLVLSAGLHPREVGVLRAYARYLHQTNTAYSQTYIERTLEEHCTVARLLVDLFLARFDPDTADRAATCAGISESIDASLADISILDQDRIIRQFHNLIDATLRTTYFQRDSEGIPRAALALKLDPKQILELPEPRPTFEIFVYSPRFEGVHLRSGPVARGGLRWSDRNEDYRTEVLGLVKAQMVKNAVIVPAGAKGGFVLKRRPADRDELMAEVVACYKGFVGALLDLTDNLVDDAVVPPENTVRHDPDDPYLVVAADKGTATFSDIANALAIERGFWLGDAFASGGSNGYDHKGMGITARGAWESVKRHFRELGRDIQSEPFTVVGVGDMSGDVFGNGMLRSEHTKLVAGFDHRNLFFDPEPDAASSFVERQRLFDLPRSSWADYDESLISYGGAIYDRNSKSISPTPEICSSLGIEHRAYAPDELISAILRAPVDLFWNGGIGTYVKSSHESHADVGDKANDNIRVDAPVLGARVVGEGGNLGMTQFGRIEFASLGGRIYTDAIDNAGGVDCSDHEVNIKILLDRVAADGDLTDKQRNALLEQMTDEVGSLVLANNYDQTQVLSTERLEAASMVDVHARYLASLESQGLLDRHLEHLPDGETLADRRLAGQGLTAPELAVLIAYTKNTLQAQLLDSHVPDDEFFLPTLSHYFPEPLRERFSSQIPTHRLRREIIANQIANRVVNRAGTSMVYRLGQETSAPPHEIAAAHMAAWEIFELDTVTSAVNELDNVLEAEQQLAIHLSARQLAERATRLLVRSRPYPFSATDAVADLALAVRETNASLIDQLVGTDKASFDDRVATHTAAGIPEDLALRAAGLGPSLASLDIVVVAADTDEPVADVAGVHFNVAEFLDLTWLRERILALPRDTQWETLARLTLRGDLYEDHRALTARVVAMGETHLPGRERVELWMAENPGPVEYYRRTISDIRATAIGDLTTLLVASREVRSLISRTG